MVVRWNQKMKKITVIFLLIGLGIFNGCITGNIAKNPEDLAEHYISAVNTRDKDAFRKIINPKCFSGLTEKQRMLIEVLFDRYFLETIPEKRKIEIIKLDSKFPFYDNFIWKVEPTHKLKISFYTNKHTSKSSTEAIAKENDQWFLILPVLNDSEMKKFFNEQKKSNKTDVLNPPSSGK